MAQLVEHILGKDEVPSSNLGSSSRKPPIVRSGALVFLELLLVDSSWVLSQERQSPVRMLTAKRVELARKRQGEASSQSEYLGVCPQICTISIHCSLLMGAFLMRSPVDSKYNQLEKKSKFCRDRRPRRSTLLSVKHSLCFM